MFRDVPECSGMFRDVPCSMFHVPGFIDARIFGILRYISTAGQQDRGSENGFHGFVFLFMRSYFHPCPTRPENRGGFSTVHET